MYRRSLASGVELTAWQRFCAVVVPGNTEGRSDEFVRVERDHVEPARQWINPIPGLRRHCESRDRARRDPIARFTVDEKWAVTRSGDRPSGCPSPLLRGRPRAAGSVGPGLGQTRLGGLGRLTAPGKGELRVLSGTLAVPVVHVHGDNLARTDLLEQDL